MRKKRHYTLDEIKDMIRQDIVDAGSARRWSAMHGLSQAYVSDFLAGKRGIGPQILGIFGMVNVFMREGDL